MNPPQASAAAPNVFAPSHAARQVCDPRAHFHRRTLLQGAGASGLAWLTPVARQLAWAAEAAPRGAPAKSVILLWLAGGPSQLETFDPQPGQRIGGDTRGIPTAIPGVQIASTLERTAELMDRVTLVRSVVSKEGDHERATYNMKTGYRPDPTLVHPSIGAVVCHELPAGKTEIPRHVSILPRAWPSRGGFLGARYDAFLTGDPRGAMPDVRPRVDQDRFDRRLTDLQMVDRLFAERRLQNLEQDRTQHQATIAKATRMMASEQLAAFDVEQATAELRAEYGDTPLGRSCLATTRLIETGVRCVEVTQAGWDSHINNHALQSGNAAELDLPLSALLRDLERRGRLRETVVICGGEFGRTPSINPAGGRDHWPHGFSVLLAGGGFAAGRVIGATDPAGGKQVENPVPVADLHATVFSALGIPFRKEYNTPIGRPMAISQGKVRPELLAES